MSEQITLKLAEDSHLGRAGQVLTLALTPQDVHDPTELPTYLAGYKLGHMRADEASPVILVDKDEDKYRSFDQDDTFRRVSVKGSIQGAIPEVDPKSSLATYKVVDRFVGSFIPEPTEQNEGPLYKARQAAMRRCQRAITLDRELDVWGPLTTNGSWATGNRVTLSAGFQWNGGASSDPILDVQNRIVASAQTPTDSFINQQSAFDFMNHAKVRDHMRFAYGDKEVAGVLAGIAQAHDKPYDFTIPGLPPFHVCGAKVKNETTGALDYILGDDLVLVSKPPGVPTDGEDIATAYTFRRRGNAGVGYETREFRIEGRGPKGGTMVVVSMADIHVQTANNVGGLVKDLRQ